ncbi:hypothetical protein OWV82_002942 [Melia azedarach]|uniref:Uncharacterized protein n=1 Tax=Melia azedarach TaxID=155640 RepID=A0ACC1Z439_MELAZ|nr:hypothetical protein OWV82_002942 [Melia azedarach]
MIFACAEGNDPGEEKKDEEQKKRQAEAEANAHVGCCCGDGGGGGGDGGGGCGGCGGCGAFLLITCLSTEARISKFSAIQENLIRRSTREVPGPGNIYSPVANPAVGKDQH